MQQPASITIPVSTAKARKKRDGDFPLARLDEHACAYAPSGRRFDGVRLGVRHWCASQTGNNRIQPNCIPLEQAKSQC